VVVSNASCLPEVAGPAALACDAANPKALADAVLAVLSDHHLRQRLVRLGLERARFFSWERSAAQMVAVFREAAKRP